LEAATTDLQTAQAAFDAQVLAARSALATIDLQTEKLKLAEQQLADTRLVAPPINEAMPIADFDQIFAVAARSVAEGTYVRTGTEVLRLVIDGYLKLKVAVPERYVGQVQVGQRVEIQTAATSVATWGQVARVNPAIQVSTRTFEVEIWVDNADRGLKPGGFAKAALIVQEETQATMVPWESVVTFAGITKVFRVEEGRARAIPVALGVAEQEWVEVVGAALKPGDLVIVSGQTNLADQTPIRRLPPAEAAAAETATLQSSDEQPSRPSGETP
jgi:membrane fusion protein (multidrug efflux system)